MPSTRDAVDVPQAAATVARRYLRVERPVTAAVAVLVVALFVVAYLQLPLLQALVVGIGLVALVRVPLVRSHGIGRLATDADPEAMRSDFQGPTLPVLALQWGIADEVERTEDDATYDVSYLFGLRSTSVGVQALVPPYEDGERGSDGEEDENGGPADLDLVVAAGGNPWATYVVSITERDGRTVVDVEVTSDRRFGLRRLPQWLIAERYRAEAFGA